MTQITFTAGDRGIRYPRYTSEFEYYVKPGETVEVVDVEQPQNCRHPIVTLALSDGQSRKFVVLDLFPLGEFHGFEPYEILADAIARFQEPREALLQRMTELDPNEADRKYAAIAIACIKFARDPWARGEEIREGLCEVLGRRLTPEDLDQTVQWLEDNSQ